MALSFQKIIVSNVSTNTAAAFFQTVTVSSVGIGNATSMNAGVSSAQFIPAGVYMYPPTANVTIELNTYASNVNVWTTIIAANTGGSFFSDGWSVRANAAVGTQTVTLYTPDGGQAATGQYNT